MHADISQFLTEYKSRITEHRQKASIFADFCRESLSDRNYDLHLITGRAKEPASLEEKILRKNYSDPSSEVTDLFGVRIITYYADQVDAIVGRLGEVLTLDLSRCLDKRDELVRSGQFGYRSVHLVGQVARPGRRWRRLEGQVFEIQARSLLDQAWAEIEHEVVYKSGVDFPGSIRRRFSAVSANFELLEREFLALRDQFQQLVLQYLEEYRAGKSQMASLDAARLAAGLEFLRPLGLSWRRSSLDGLIPVATPASCVRGLDGVGITNLNQLAAAIDSREASPKFSAVASDASSTPSELSHPLVCAVLVGMRDWKILERYMPSLADASEVRNALA